MRSFYSLCLCVALGAAVGCANNIQLQDQPVDSGLSGTNPVTGADEVDEPDTGGGTVTTPGGNRAPIADAGPDLTGTVPEEIVLDASASTDPDGDILNYAWVLTEVPADSAAFLINENRIDASFYADREGTYIAELTVDDNELSSSDSVIVTVSAPNEGPVANAGPDQNVAVGSRVVLNGANSYDPDGDPLEFEWTLVSTPTGSAASLDDRGSAVPAFSADVAGAYVAELVVNDGVDTSGTDQVRIVASTGGGGGGDGCLGCAAQELSRGNAAGALTLVLLPLLVAVRRRRAG